MRQPNHSVAPNVEERSVMEHVQPNVERTIQQQRCACCCPGTHVERFLSFKRELLSSIDVFPYALYVKSPGR